MKLDLHHYFNSLEHGLTKASRGEDYLLVTESSLEGLVRDKAGQFAEHTNCEITIVTACRPQEKQGTVNMNVDGVCRMLEREKSEN